MSEEVAMASLLEAMERQTKAMARITSAMLTLAKATHALAEAVYADVTPEEEDRDSPSVDMAGRPIRHS